MADEADLAPDYNASALAAHLKQAKVDSLPPRMLSDFCEDCGEEIPKKRREAQPGCVLCVPCAMENG